MYKLKYCILFFLISVLFIACKEELPATLSKSDAIPNAVTNVQVKNLNGGAKLKYVLPSNPDLLYIKAVFESPKGNMREVKASMYTDSIMIEGIGSTAELNVQLYAVSRSEVLSSPVTVKINPLTPSVVLVGRSLTLTEDFGGVRATFENLNQSNVVINIIRNDGTEWIPIETAYTSKKSGSFNARGQTADSQNYGVFAIDRWGNRSDTLTAILTPKYEAKLTGVVSITTLPSDYNKFYQIYNYNFLFDGVVGAVLNYAGTLLNSPASALPQSFTMDFRVPTSFSRLKYWAREDGGSYYNRGTPEVFEVWGSNTLNDDWSTWTKIFDWTTVKPSGQPLGQLTQEDKDVSVEGYDATFPPSNVRYRYLRWKTTKNFGRVDYVQMSELTFWGSQQ